MYAIVIMQSFCGCLAVLQYEKQRDTPITPGQVALLAITFVVLPLGHWFSVAFACGLLGALFLWALADRKLNYALLYVALGAALVGLGGTWIAYNFGSTLGRLGSYGGHVYLGSVSLWGLRVTGTGTLLFAVTLNPLLIASAALGAWCILTNTRAQIGPAIILAVSVALGLTIIAVSFFDPVYQTRNFTWLVAPIALFSAMGIESVFSRLSLSRALQALVLIGVLMVSAAIAAVIPRMPRIYEVEMDDWRGAGRVVAATLWPISGCLCQTCVDRSGRSTGAEPA